MEIVESRLGEVPYLSIDGDVDHYNAPLLEKAMEAVSGDRVILDLTRCRYLDSGGLGVILTAVKGHAESGWVGVVGPNRDVRRLLEIVGLTVEPAFRVFDTDAEASAQVVSEPA